MSLDETKRKKELYLSAQQNNLRKGDKQILKTLDLKMGCFTIPLV